MTNSHVDKDGRFAGVIAEDYDATFRLICPHLDQLQQSVADALMPLRQRVLDRNLKILDLGCGDGLTSRVMLKTIKGVDLVALDNEPQMILQIKENLGDSYGSSSIVFVLEDALSFLQKCEDASLDGIGSCFVLHNCHEDYRRKVLHEIYRVLKQSGVFVNADKLAQPQPLHGQTFLKQLTLVIDSYTAAGRLDLMREWIVHYLEDNIPGRLWFESDAVHDLKMAGFTTIENTFRYDLEATLVAVKQGAA
jgi:ubiquinone/menaquinone biosynthesis C-methylase UbiE